MNGYIWNGRGKEFSGKKLIFEGEYLNGIRWNGKGIVTLTYEIVYINGAIIKKLYY